MADTKRWRVKFMRAGWEPPYPFGRCEEVVEAASRAEAIARVKADQPVSPDYPITASVVKNGGESATLHDVERCRFLGGDHLRIDQPGGDGFQPLAVALAQRNQPLAVQGAHTRCCALSQCSLSCGISSPPLRWTGEHYATNRPVC